jgi:hypothetical protein
VSCVHPAIVARQQFSNHVPVAEVPFSVWSLSYQRRVDD